MIIEDALYLVGKWNGKELLYGVLVSIYKTGKGLYIAETNGFHETYENWNDVLERLPFDLSQMTWQLALEDYGVFKVNKITIH